MGRATFVTLDMLSALHAAEIGAGLRGDLDAAAQHLDRAETLTQAAVAQTPKSPEEAVEQLRIARWLAGFSDCPLFADALADALAVVESEGLSGRALHLVRRAAAMPSEDPYAEQALHSFWRGAVARSVSLAAAGGDASLQAE